MAGRERSGRGRGAGRPVRGPRLGRRPRPGGRPRRPSRRCSTWRSAVGAAPIRMTPAEHDAAVAAVSHVPQVAASLVAARLRELPDTRGGPGRAGAARRHPDRGQRPRAVDPDPRRQRPGVRDVLDELRGRPRRGAAAVGALDAGARHGGDGQGARGVLARAVASGNAGARADPGQARRARRRRTRPCRSWSPTSRARWAGCSPTSARPASTSRTCTSSTASAQPVGLAELAVLPASAEPLDQRPAAARLARARLSRLRAGAPWGPSGGRGVRPSSAATTLSGDRTRCRTRRRHRRPLRVGQVQRLAGRRPRPRLGYLDTGAMYRALTWWCLARGRRPRRPRGGRRGGAPAAAGRSAPTPAAPSVPVGGRDVGRRRSGTTRISAVRLEVATNLEVRAELLQRQRDIIADSLDRSGGVVAEGRDITTVVAPDADVRVLLDGERGGAAGPARPELHGEAHDAGRRRDPRPDRPPRPRRLHGVAVHRRPPTASYTSTPPTWTSSETVQAVLDVVAERAGTRAGLKSARRWGRPSRQCEAMDADRGITVHLPKDPCRERAPRDRRAPSRATTPRSSAPCAPAWRTSSSATRTAPCSSAGDDGSSTTAPRPARCRSSPSSAAPTSASRPWSTGSSAAARPSSRTCPGVTRDRVTYDAEWTGRRFTLVDTGGWEHDATGIHAAGRRAGRGRRRPRRRRACSSSTPPSAPPTPTRPSSSCCAGPASRSCSSPTRSTTSAPRPTPRRCGASGLGEPCPVSALHGRGSGDLLDAVLEALPEVSGRRRRLRARRPAPGRAARPARTSASPSC